MEYRKLGSSNLNVSVISFGAWQIGDSAYWGEVTNDADAVSNDAVVHAALDAGINLFDTAEMYGAGESERALGQALGSRRSEILIASKVLPDNCHPDKLRKACEASLARLGTDYIDLYQVHWPPRDVPFADCYGALLELKQEGKIREIGVSNFGPVDLAAWLKTGVCVSNQVGYNLVFRAVEHEIGPACIKNGIGILAYVPLLQGILSCRWKTAEEVPHSRRRTRHFAAGRPGVRHTEPGCEALMFEMLDQLAALAAGLGHAPAELALAWLLAQPGVTSAIIGARKPQQLARNLAALELAPDRTWLAELDSISDGLKEALGTNADMWCSESRIR